MKLQDVVRENIKGYRKKLGLTQEAVASRLKNMHSNQFAKIERGIEGVTLERIEQLAKIYGIEPHMLLIAKSFKL
jgi:transcriptional regulator with XRE-family HTH domain